jgi:hypothetical protein
MNISRTSGSGNLICLGFTDLLTEIMRARRLEFQCGQSLNLFSSNMNHAGMQLKDTLDEQKGFLGDNEPVLFKKLWTDNGV